MIKLASEWYGLIIRFDFKTHFLIGSCFSSGAWIVNHFQNSTFLFRINPEITWTSSSIFCNKIFILGVAYDLWIKKKEKICHVSLTYTIKGKSFLTYHNPCLLCIYMLSMSKHTNPSLPIIPVLWCCPTFQSVIKSSWS